MKKSTLFNKLILSITLILSISVFAFSQTDIPAGEITTTTWTKANSPYYIKGDVTIKETSTLTIEPGVEVIMQADAEFIVSGNIVAIGTASDSISFSANATWQGLEFIARETVEDSTILDFCKISDSNNSGVFIKSNRVRISNSRIFNNFAAYNGGGISLEKSNAVILNNCIEKNEAPYGAGVSLYLSESLVKGNIIRNNKASRNAGGIYVSESYDVIANNLVCNNTSEFRGSAIYVERDGTYPYVYYKPCKIINNTIVKNASEYIGALYVRGKTEIYINNVIWSNSATQIFLHLFGQAFDNNAVMDPFLHGTNCVPLDTLNMDINGPKFTNPEANDYTLQSSSILKGAGIPAGSDIGYTNSSLSMVYATGSRVIEDVKGNTFGTVTPYKSYVLPDEACTFTLVPEDDALIVSVTFNGEDILDKLVKNGEEYTYTVNNINEDCILVADFSPEYTVQILQTPNGQMGPEGLKVTHNLETVFTISPDPGYKLDSLLVNGGNKTSSVVNIEGKPIYEYTLKDVTTFVQLIPYFSYGSFTVSASAEEEGGTITPSGDFKTTYDDVIDYVIRPKDYWVIDSLMYNFTDIKTQLVPDGESYKLKLENVVCDSKLKACFSQVSSTINITAGSNGTVTPIGDTVLTFSDKIVLNIVPDDNFTIDSFIIFNENRVDELKITNSGYSYTIIAGISDIYVYAGFKPFEFNVSVNTTNGGSITPNGDTIITYLDTIKYKLVPDKGWELAELNLNNVNVKDELIELDETFVYTLHKCDTNSELNSVFELIEYPLAFKNNAGGSVTARNNEETANIESQIDILISAGSAYKLVSFTKNGIDITNELTEDGVDKLYVLTKVTEPISFVATFEVKTNISNDNAKEFTIYPVPVSNDLYIDLGNNQNALVKIIDASGKILSETQVHSKSSVNVSDLQSGNYQLLIICNNKTYNKPFIKQ